MTPAKTGWEIGAAYVNVGEHCTLRSLGVHDTEPSLVVAFTCVEHAKSATNAASSSVGVKSKSYQALVKLSSVHTRLLHIASTIWFVILEQCAMRNGHGN